MSTQHTKIAVVFVILMSALNALGATPEQLAEEKQLQEQYPGYRGVSDDYLHAGKEAVEQFHDLKYGLRIHWGIYSIWGDEASLNLSTNIGGPVEKYDNAKRAEYFRLADQFNPTEFDADEWMELFKELGFTFFSITTKHCDGFSLFDTKTKVKKCWDWTAEGGPKIIDCDTHYSIMDSPYKKDIIRQLTDAAHKHGLKIDLYFSHPDWFDADQRFDLWNPLRGTPICDEYTKESDPVSYWRFMKRHRQQITELLTNYGEIDMMCLDMRFPEWAEQDLIDTVKVARKIQPQVMFRNRGIGAYGDYNTPERWYPETPDDPRVIRPWLAIDPVGEIFAYQPDGAKYRDHKWLLTTLIEVVSKGGNFSPAIGPDATGRFHPTVIEYLRIVGDWLKVNGEAIYKTRPWYWFSKGKTVRFTRSKDNDYVYAIMLKWDGDTLVLDNIKPKDGAKITLLADTNETALEWNYLYDKLFITGFGSKPVHGKYAWAVKIPIDKNYYDKNFVAALTKEKPLETTINLNKKSEGRIFEGIGALSAGASSRLLIDYDEPYRSDILDYLFKPKFGANLQHLKVEIGSDNNSSTGSEPSHARTREELENPKQEYYQRGYEWWLMAEAKKRNPDIILEGLQWGAPGWIGDGNFFSRDNAEFIAAWVKGAKKYHDLDIDYVGVWNERKYDVEYIKLLRKVLDENGLRHVKIDAGDLWLPQEMWDIADDMVRDEELRKAVAVINAHTTEMVDHKTSESVKALNIPIWNGEAHAYGGNFKAARTHASYNRAYPIGRITKIISWSVISSYHDYLLVPHSGPMKANTPWSGYYDVQPPIWAIAHTTQFTQPGWRYLDSGSALLKDGSVTTLISPNGEDYSIIIETMEAKDRQKVTFKLSEGFPRKDLSVWRSTLERDLFVQADDIKATGSEFTIELEPDSIYSLTTTHGQKKGMAKRPVPANFDFPLYYFTNFEFEPAPKPAKYFCDQQGVFDVVERPDNKGQCLKQTITIPGIQWREFPHPLTVIGDIDWTDYEASMDFMLPGSGSVKLVVRTDHLNGWTSDFTGYFLEIDHLGNWKLTATEDVLASGKVNNIGNKWHRVSLACLEDKIKAAVDGKVLAEVKNKTIKSGVVGIGTGWNEAYFDNFKITETYSK